MEEDRISMLPDEVIEVILSRLTIADATRTSILSSRWRHIWRYFSGSLDFNGELIIYVKNYIYGELPDFLPKGRKRFIRWVNRVLKSIQSPTLEGLRISFDMTDHSSEVDGWVQYAIQKKVKKLELNLKYYIINGYFPLKYDISSLLLNFTSLISLRLTYVDVSGESLEYLLSSCPCLEELSVKNSESLLSLKISMPSLKLKRLELIGCIYLKNLELNVKSLVSFAYSSGKDLAVVYKSVPNLVELSLQPYYINADFHRLYPYLSQIKVLNLHFYKIQCPFQLPANFSKLANVHHLQLSVWELEEEGCFDFYVSLMNACTSLSVLTLQFLKELTPSFEIVAQFDMKHAYYFLEEVNVVGFTGSSFEVEFIMYIVRNTINLKKLIIDTIQQVYKGISFEYCIRKTFGQDSFRARAIARNMRARIPRGVKIIIL